MPLRDHFRPPILDNWSWEGFHGLWPGFMVQQLARLLPDEYIVEPRVHLGTNFEIDVSACERDAPPPWLSEAKSVGTALATYAPPAPSRVAEVELTEEYAYEVLVFQRNRELVAALEIVSLGNKDRPEARQAFVSKCAALLQNRICVSIVDLVTTRRFNLYGDLMELAGEPDPDFTALAPATYAVTCRGRKVGGKPRLEIWSHPLVVGQPLPTLPIWLTEDSAVSLDLEACYEETCRTLRIR